MLDLVARNRIHLTMNSDSPRKMPFLSSGMDLAARFVPSTWNELELLLPDYLARRNSISAARNVHSVRIQHAFLIEAGDSEIWFLIVRADLHEGIPRTYSIPLTLVPEAMLDDLLLPTDECVLAHLPDPTPGALCYAMAVQKCCESLVQTIQLGRTYRSGEFEIAAISLSEETDAEDDFESAISVRLDERHTSIEFGESYILKMYHRIEIRPRDSADAGSVPILGYLEMRSPNGERAVLAELHKFLAE